ncbi:hypothetical protein LMH87_006761 [Akanthomyces muscarius]|uniref:Uncharacterized protein n=1 Tax=Akanthomyces muscarius TaxID=2231603 RepID=A0A9W8UTH1_AKAMU|nr:hypothetical protein LMH87_006761 [Akanthomyces muscarius]KAJ4165114.1 hypothetical protein LMH87_006761 [Akanthomyces muscarius]
MSYSASQFEDLIDAIHRKNGKKPPKDQAELLEKDESWIHQLRKKPHGAANVPNHVLQTVTAAHEARVKQTASRASQSVKNAEQELPKPSSSRDHDSVPETVIAETTRRTKVDKRQRPVKRFKPINLGSDSPTKPKADEMATRDSRMQSLKHLEVAETQETVVSSSIVAATLTQTQTQNATSTAQEPAEDAPEEMADIENSASVAEEAQSSSEELLSAKSHSSGGEEHQQGQQGGGSMEDSEDQAETPFGEFCAAYPDYCESYNGSRLNFVSTCVYLEFLRDTRALRDYLYDDFIRFFSCNFLDYVNNAGPGQEPISAIERYNMQSGQPLYNRHIINNTNLGRVLTFYKREASETRNLQAQYEQDQAPEAAVTPKATGPEPVSPAPLAEAVQDPMEVDEPRAEASSQSGAVHHQVPAQDKVLDERPISPPGSPSNTAVDRRANSASKQVISVAESTRSPQASSPQLGRRTVSAAPPSSMRSNAPVASQYIQRLAMRSASTGEDAARQHREKVRAALRRKRASASARSSSSKAGSVA